ncbi:SDR family oxidoreductase [Shewanella submarina]|uniref:SDR family oxidoreductase n=1 Tax=Shewanella submarina TaxID=2016376 RepID=A0ABV7GCL5_9GAMM|nr:SDR family oxidoreductase [Shewanella submarina]MCL1036576.1 SDR family oxidoreductase [Shewanella submarina]
MKIAVTGCGWYGLALAKVLLQQGHTVIGSKRDSAGCELLEKEGIQAVALDLAADVDALACAPLFDVDAMVVNIPPGLRRGDSDYLGRLQKLKQLMLPNRLKKLIFISTTGVYPNAGRVSEADAGVYSTGSETLLAAEALFLDAPELLSEEGQVSVLRFAGLVGPGRHPGRFLAGKTGITGGNQSVNLVHLEDCVAATCLLLDAGRIGPVYNLCTRDHLPKAQFYPLAAASLGLEPPQFGDDADTDKQVDGSHICHDLDFDYRYKSLIDLLNFC